MASPAPIANCIHFFCFLRSFIATFILLGSLLLLSNPDGSHAQSTDNGESRERSEVEVGMLDVEVLGMGAGISGSADGILGRATTSDIVRGLENGVPKGYNMNFGDINYWVLEATELFVDDTATTRRDELRKRDSTSDGSDQDGDPDSTSRRLREKRQTGQQTVYLTFNTCLQPQSNTTASASESPPQLQLFISNSTTNQSPSPWVRNRPQTAIPVTQGFANLTFIASGTIWVGVYAPEVTSSNQWSGVYYYELVLSTTQPYHGYIDDQFLYLVDTDNNSALLITGNMTTTSADEGGVDEDADGNELITRDPPYTMYAQNVGIPSRFFGLERSYCAVTTLAQIRPASSDVDMTVRGLGNLPKQQFHLRELNKTSEYQGYLARPINSSSSSAPSNARGGGILWRPTNFTTKTDGNCQLIYNLPFCSEVAYAVPSNPTLFSEEALRGFYDGTASSWYQNFSYSLQQIACNITSSSQYSLARDCDDCDRTYRNWLCAVTIPRCMDYSSNYTYLASRGKNTVFYNGTTNSSQLHPFTSPLTDEEVAAITTNGSSVATRNPIIDEVVRPGPYKEIKPCKDLCWDLVQSCPSGLGFACPWDSSPGSAESYGTRDEDGDVTCSFLGAVYFLSDAGRTWRKWDWWTWGVGMWVLWCVM
ncbi:hypothetical protein RUND412_010826 [Rhizina undulata]